MIRSQAVTYVQAHFDEYRQLIYARLFTVHFIWKRSVLVQNDKKKREHLMSAEENKKVQRRVFEALNRKDANGAGELSAPVSVFFQERSSAKYAPDRASHRDTPPVQGCAE